MGHFPFLVGSKCASILVFWPHHDARLNFSPLQTYHHILSKAIVIILMVMANILTQEVLLYIEFFLPLAIAASDRVTVHNRLRDSIRFLKSFRKSKSKRLFLTQGRGDNFALFVRMTQILCKIIFSLC